MAASSGATANRTGANLERGVAEILELRGYEYVGNKEFFSVRDLEKPVYSTQVNAGLDIYGKRRRVDLMLYHPRIYPGNLVIQCKWQAASGSVDEKYPFEVLSIEQSDYDTIIVLDGGGYKPEAKEWLVAQADKERRLKHVFALGEFQKFSGKKGNI